MLLHLLIVDDDPRVSAMLARYLDGRGLPGLRGRRRGGHARLPRTSEVDLVLLDLVLPGEDGLTLAREIRAAHPGIGIVMITGRDDVIDRVAGLEVGADDYIAKPFHLREVLARIRTVLRRRQPRRRRAASAEPAGEVCASRAGWSSPPSGASSGPDGREVPLTTGEFDLLLAFATHAGRVLERDRLLDLVKGRDWAAYDRSIDQQVARLRRKIEPDPANPSLIRSVRGVGYLFAAEVRRG